jgi:putative SOS response-associated peptidase YedK
VTFTIVTCAANAAIAEIHDRMPIVLDERAAEDWMNPLERDPLSLKRLLVPVANDLLAIRPASPLVNSVKNEGPALLEVGVTRNIFCRVEPMRKFGSRLRHSHTVGARVATCSRS